MRFVCESCRAQYMINDEKVGPKGVKVRCRKCGYVILVKRATEPSFGAPSPAGDPDDSLATQVMQTPFGASPVVADESGHDDDSERTQAISAEALQRLVPAAMGGGHGEAAAPKKDSFFGADDADEIGAVFDQVLRSTNPSMTPVRDDLGDELGDAENRDSTRVLDAAMVRRLAEESGGGTEATAPAASTDELAPVQPEGPPQTDWYVAIDEKQTGPLTLEQVKTHWEHGEIGPDSLCWRAGFDDWVPLSEVKMLGAVLAPTPAKPIVMPPATITQSVPAVVSVPVQSAFSSGGMMQSVQSEMQVPMAAAAPREDSGAAWQPSAALSLASLVKDELEVLSNPASNAPPPVFEEISSAPRGLLELPKDAAPALPSVPPAPKPSLAPPPAPAVSLAESPPPPTNPYLAGPSRSSAPALQHQRASNSRSLLIGLVAGGAVVLLVLVGLIVWLVTRTPQVAAPAIVTAAPVPTQLVVNAPPPPVVNAPPPQPAPEAATPVAAAPSPTTPTPAPPTPQTQMASPTPAPAAEKSPAAETTPNPVMPKASAPRPPKPVAVASTHAEKEPEPEPRAEPRKTPAADDDFDKAFGGGEAKKAPKEEAPKTEKKTVGYIPPPPGAASGDIKAELGESDIMEVVLANKSALAKCVEEQRKKEPGTSGRLVMRWTIQTSGRTSNVNVVSEEFKGSHIANCIGQLIKGWQFPRHKKQGEPVTFPFKF